MTGEDALAGLFLLLFGLLGIVLYTAITYSMIRMSHEIVGFRFLISQAISDILLMIQFAVWPGLVILCQNEWIPESWRWHLHVYLDFTWFNMPDDPFKGGIPAYSDTCGRWAMVYHYSIVAWSRLAAVQWPNWFRTLQNGTCVLICLSAWFLGLVQSLVEHQFQWFEPLFYNPRRYGMDADWNRYVNGGTSSYYMAFNVALMVIPFPFYAIALAVLFKRQRKRIVDLKTRPPNGRSPSLTPMAFAAQRQLSIETRLLIPCICNTILFVVGQVFIAVCSKHGKWMNWAVMVVFSANSIANPILYLFFSSVIRKHVLFDCRNRFSLSAIYQDYEYRSSLSQHRQSLLKARDTTISSDLNRIGAYPKASISA